MTRKIMTLLSLIVITSMLLVACGGGAAPTAVPAAAEEVAPTEVPAEAPAEEAAPTEAPAEEAPAEEAVATEAPAEEAPAEEATEAPMEEAPVEAAADTALSGEALPGGALEAAYAGEFDGTVVTMMGPFVDQDEINFAASIAAFEEATGIDIQYEGTKEFESIISTRVDGGDAPDIVDFPQPGLLKNFVADGKVVDVSEFLPADYMSEQYLDSWLDMATMAGPDGDIMAGVWTRFNGKSLVWYNKVAWDEAGYEIPTTWAEMIELSDMIVADGDTPWCIGIESGAATGWAATDWMEDLMLRTTTLENYDAWTTGDLPFSSPEVTAAAETMAEIWLNPDYVLGGTQAIVSTSVGNSILPLFEDPPRCWLHRQANFITANFPELEAGVDYDFFYLPPVDESLGRPFLIAGDIYSMFNDRPEVRAVMEFFTRGESVREWLRNGGTLAPHKDIQPDWYTNVVDRGVAEIAAAATAVRFDGSDLMPGEVGAGSFWTGMTNFVAGTVDLETALEEIDASWPR
jgi:alpha-glucoside transport system substrate-binding protein